MAEVTLAGVTKSFPGGTLAVDHVDLEIADGELLVLVGPSGSGKTTVLRLTAGLEDLTDGEIRIGGEVVNDLHPMDRDIAMVFQSYALYPHMTVRENIGFNLRLRRRPKREIRERVERTAAMLDSRSACDRGELVTLAVDPATLHFFDPETEIALS
jgi:multiple sugar transport system ATP-binding protein